MDQRTNIDRASVTGFVASRRKTLRAGIGLHRLECRGDAGMTEAATAEIARAASEVALKLHIQSGRKVGKDGYARLFPGPSARPAVTPRFPMTEPAPHVQSWVQQLPYPDTERSRMGTVTSIGVRFFRAFRSLFV